MKKLLVLSLALTLMASLFSQAPEKMSYQAVIRNAAGELVKNIPVSMRISIMQHNATSGIVVFSEIQTANTNINGLVSFDIGGGSVLSGTIASINWADGPYFLKTETDVTGGTIYTITGTSQLLTVPYALYAKTAGSFTETDGSVTNELQTLSISNDTLFLSNGGFVKLPPANQMLIPPSASAEGISEIENFSAVLNGTVNANNLMTTVEFEWGTTESYGNTVLAEQSPFSGLGDVHVTATIGSLQTDENYHYRIKAGNVVNFTYSNDMPFSINPANLVLPSVATAAVTDISGVRASGGGALVSTGGAYITEQGLCWGLSPEPDTSGNKTSSFSEALQDLTENTVYYVRAYAVNAAGIAYGSDIMFNSGFVLGTDTLGGIVFYNDGSGHGLVCAAADLEPRMSWGCYGTLINTTSPDLGTGYANTADIIAGCSTAGIAARMCDNLVVDIFDDWYLPSKDELALIYKNLKSAGMGNFANEQYWTSSEVNSAVVWYQHFSGGLQHYDGKDTPFKVRPVRSF